MQLALKFALIVLNAFCIVSGQALMGVMSRALTQPIEPWRAVRELAQHPASYGFLACYALSTLVYMALLRSYALAEVTLSILVVIIVMTALYTYWLGDQMSARQWAGVVVILLGVILLQGR
ncbi:MAG: hypothetical protein ACKVP7_06760 [Hyphomicrobiaceae bacterium]